MSVSNIIVENEMKQHIEVCIGRWQTEDTSWVTINPGLQQQFDRNDARGFVMVVNRHLLEGDRWSHYFIRDRGVIHIKDASATVDEHELKPVFYAN